MSSPAATLGCHHLCPAHDGQVPHVGGPVRAGSPDVFFTGKAACRTGDPLHCNSASCDRVARGSPTVFINGHAAARLGDPTDHGGIVVEGVPTISIG
jgi:uncharacterized Zn-binding protein involved in type VI secretion